MEIKESIANKSFLKEDMRLGFLVIATGGAGKTSARRAHKRHKAAGSPFSMCTMAIDTDPTEFEFYDFAINIAPTREAISAMACNPERYGPACKAIVRQHPYLLESETLGHGARTNGIITQAAFELFERQIIKGLQRAIHSLLRQGQLERILPVVVSSLGGGTGSASVILLQDFFVDATKKTQIMLGLPPDLLARSVAFVIDPYTHVLQQCNDIAPDWILSNIYATRVELAEYEKLGKGYQYTFHLGLGNDSGAVFSTIEQVCEANGLLVWEWMANYAMFKSRAVDNLDFFKESSRYKGNDVPEHFFTKGEIPPYGDKVNE